MAGGLAQLPATQFFTLYGEVLYLLFHAPLQRLYSVADIEKRIIQPMDLDQFRIYRAERGPVALITWAFIDDELHARMRDGQIDLAPHEWNCGPHLWFIEFIAPFGQARLAVDDLCANIFPDQVGWSYKVTGRKERPFILKKYVGRNRRAGASQPQ